MNAEEILAATPEEIFSKPDRANIDSEFIALAKKWHPDLNSSSKANEVLVHLNLAKKLAEEKLEKGIWQAPRELTLKREYDKNLKIQFKRHHSFELGELYICDHSIAYLVKPSNNDLLENSVKTVNNFKFASDKMQQEFMKYLPSLLYADTKWKFKIPNKLIVFSKKPEQILLRDVVNFGKLDPKHVAWIISGLLNIACYLHFSEISHNDISLDTVYIDPATHTVSLLGGWWYAVKIGEKLKAVPCRTLNLLPPKTLASKLASPRTDLELIRAIARELLGDTTGVGSISSVPKSLLDWGRYPTSGSAKEDYTYWLHTVLPAAFGKRTFTQLSLTAKQIYGA